MADSVRFHKILTLAVNPAAQEGEAQAAFNKLRDLVREHPHLSNPPPPPVSEPIKPNADEVTWQWTLSKVRPFWFPIVVDNLSGHAYSLGLRSRIACDFTQTPTLLTLTCTGSAEACDQFAALIKTLTDWINTQPVES